MKTSAALVAAMVSILVLRVPLQSQARIGVPETRRFAIYQAVHLVGRFAWDENANSRKAGLPRILPPDRQKISANTLWPSYQKELQRERVAEGPDTVIPAGFCRRGDMSVADALGKP
jgi:hypothetical protein